MNLDDELYENEAERKTFIPISLLNSQGNKYLRQLQFKEALSSFDKVLEQDPKNVQALLSRAKCNMRLAKYVEALIDFDQVMELNPRCTEAVYLKGVTEYLRGNFESGFLTYWEGHRLRPYCEKFRRGYQFCKKAIENNLIADKSMALTVKDIARWNKFMRSKKLEDSERTDYDHKGVFSRDLRVLEDLSCDKNLGYIRSMCKDVFHYLRERQKFSAMEEPLCMKTHKPGGRVFLRQNIYNFVKMHQLVRNFELCKIALKEGRPAMCIKKADEVLGGLHTLAPDFPEKKEMEAETLHCLVVAYLAEGKFGTAMKYCEQQQNFINENGLPEDQGRVLTDFAEIYYLSKKYDKAVEVFQECLGFIQNERERSIILYKLAECYIYLNNLKAARDAAQKCLDLVVGYHNSRFQFDVLLLLAEVYVKARSMKLAEKHYREALEIALHNHDHRQHELKHILEILEEALTRGWYKRDRLRIVKITDELKHIE